MKFEFNVKGEVWKLIQFDGRTAIPHSYRHCSFYMLKTKNGLMRLSELDWVWYTPNDRAVISNEMKNFIMEAVYARTD